MLESYLLPVQATVLGPGEIAYWAQLTPLFAALGVPMPEIVPRSSWSVIEPRVDRLLTKAGIEPADLADGGEGVVTSIVDRSRPAEIERSLEKLAGELESRFAELDGATSQERPGLVSAVGKARSQCLSALATFRKVVDGSSRELQQTVIGQVRRAARHLHPGGVPQERALSPFGYLFRYGEQFLEQAHAVHGLAVPEAAASDGPDVAGDSGGA